MMIIRLRQNKLFKLIAIRVALLLIFNQLAWAYPADTLAPPTTLANEDGQQELLDEMKRRSDSGDDGGIGVTQSQSAILPHRGLKHVNDRIVRVLGKHLEVLKDRAEERGMTAEERNLFRRFEQWYSRAEKLAESEGKPLDKVPLNRKLPIDKIKDEEDREVFDELGGVIARLKVVRLPVKELGRVKQVDGKKEEPFYGHVGFEEGVIWVAADRDDIEVELTIMHEMKEYKRAWEDANERGKSMAWMAEFRDKAGFNAWEFFNYAHVDAWKDVVAECEEDYGDLKNEYERHKGTIAFSAAKDEAVWERRQQLTEWYEARLEIMGEKLRRARDYLKIAQEAGMAPASEEFGIGVTAGSQSEETSLKAAVEARVFDERLYSTEYFDVYCVSGDARFPVVMIPKHTMSRQRVEFAKQNLEGIVPPFTVLENVTVQVAGAEYENEPFVIVRKRLVRFEDQHHIPGAWKFDKTTLRYSGSEEVNDIGEQVVALSELCARRGVASDGLLMAEKYGLDPDDNRLYICDFGGIHPAKWEDCYVDGNLMLPVWEHQTAQLQEHEWASERGQASPVPDVQLPSVGGPTAVVKAPEEQAEGAPLEASRQITVPAGFHVRPSSAMRALSKIMGERLALTVVVENEQTGQSVNGLNMLGLMNLGVAPKQTVRVKVTKKPGDEKFTEEALGTCLDLIQELLNDENATNITVGMEYSSYQQNIRALAAALEDTEGGAGVTLSRVGVMPHRGMGYVNDCIVRALGENLKAITERLKIPKGDPDYAKFNTWYKGRDKNERVDDEVPKIPIEKLSDRRDYMNVEFPDGKRTRLRVVKLPVKELGRINGEPFYGHIGFEEGVIWVAADRDEAEVAVTIMHEAKEYKLAYLKAQELGCDDMKTIAAWRDGRIEERWGGYEGALKFFNQAHIDACRDTIKAYEDKYDEIAGTISMDTHGQEVRKGSLKMLGERLDIAERHLLEAGKTTRQAPSQEAGAAVITGGETTSAEETGEIVAAVHAASAEEKILIVYANGRISYRGVVHYLDKKHFAGKRIVAQDRFGVDGNVSGFSFYHNDREVYRYNSDTGESEYLGPPRMTEKIAEAKKRVLEVVATYAARNEWVSDVKIAKEAEVLIEALKKYKRDPVMAEAFRSVTPRSAVLAAISEKASKRELPFTQTEISDIAHYAQPEISGLVNDPTDVVGVKFAALPTQVTQPNCYARLTANQRDIVDGINPDPVICNFLAGLLLETEQGGLKEGYVIDGVTRRLIELDTSLAELGAGELAAATVMQFKHSAGIVSMAKTLEPPASPEGAADPNRPFPSEHCLIGSKEFRAMYQGKYAKAPSGDAERLAQLLDRLNPIVTAKHKALRNMKRSEIYPHGCYWISEGVCKFLRENGFNAWVSPGRLDEHATVRVTLPQGRTFYFDYAASQFVPIEVREKLPVVPVVIAEDEIGAIPRGIRQNYPENRSGDYIPDQDKPIDPKGDEVCDAIVRGFQAYALIDSIGHEVTDLREKGQRLGVPIDVEIGNFGQYSKEFRDELEAKAAQMGFDIIWGRGSLELAENIERYLDGNETRIVRGPIKEENARKHNYENRLARYGDRVSLTAVDDAKIPNDNEENLYHIPIMPIVEYSVTGNKQNLPPHVVIQEERKKGIISNTMKLELPPAKPIDVKEELHDMYKMDAVFVKNA